MEKMKEGENMVEHHIRYKEIDGYDETVWMSKSEHGKLHQKLRREGECNIPVEELARISAAAYGRTEKGKSKSSLWEEKHPDSKRDRNKKYNETHKESREEYRKEWEKKNPNYMKEYKKKWKQKNKDKINQQNRERYARKKIEKEMI